MDDDWAQQILLKQTVLKKEIIDKGFAGHTFLTWCQTKKANGNDMNSWTIEELKQLTVDFAKEQEERKEKEESKAASSLVPEAEIKENVSPPKEEIKESVEGEISKDPVPQPEAEIKENVSPPKEEIKESVEAEISKDPVPQPDVQHEPEPLNYEKEITCKKLEKTVLNDKEVAVLLKNPKVNGAYSSLTSYVSYEVVTESLQKSVSRRFSDFEWLRSILCKCFPRLTVPLLPGKKLGKRRLEQSFIDKRMAYLQAFINSVTANESFKTSEALVAFLSMSDPDQFEAKKKDMTAYQPSPYVEEARTLTGQVTVIDKQGNEQYYSNISVYFRLQHQLFERLNSNMKNFHKSITQACENLDAVQKDFETLNLLNTRVQMKREISLVYEELGVFFKNWRRILANQNDTFKAKIKDTFKLFKMDGIAYSELIRSREDVKAKFMVEESRLLVKKDRLWKEGDVAKWEIDEEEMSKLDKAALGNDRTVAMKHMCTQDTRNLENLHQQLGYANKMNMDELRRILNEYVTRLNGNMKSFADAFYPSLTDGISVWSTLNHYL